MMRVSVGLVVIFGVALAYDPLPPVDTGNSYLAIIHTHTHTHTHTKIQHYLAGLGLLSIAAALMAPASK